MISNATNEIMKIFIKHLSETIFRSFNYLIHRYRHRFFQVNTNPTHDSSTQPFHFNINLSFYSIDVIVPTRLRLLRRLSIRSFDKFLPRRYFFFV